MSIAADSVTAATARAAGGSGGARGGAWGVALAAWIVGQQQPYLVGPLLLLLQGFIEKAVQSQEQQSRATFGWRGTIEWLSS